MSERGRDEGLREGREGRKEGWSAEGREGRGGAGGSVLVRGGGTK